MKLGGTGMGRANFVVARGVWRNIQLHKRNGGFGWALGRLAENGSNCSSFVIIETIFSGTSTSC